MIFTSRGVKEPVEIKLFQAPAPPKIPKGTKLTESNLSQGYKHKTDKLVPLASENQTLFFNNDEK